MTEKLTHHVLYLNGLGKSDLSTPESSLERFLKSPSIYLTHLALDWHSDNTFQSLFEKTVDTAEQYLKKYGRVAIVGASAGGSLGVSVFKTLRQEYPSDELSLICLSSRLRYSDPIELENDAKSSVGKKPSLAYLESVTHCETVSLPSLNNIDKQYMKTVRPIVDQVVPVEAMAIEGVDEYIVPVYGHFRGIAKGVLMIPKILEDIYA